MEITSKKFDPTYQIAPSDSEDTAEEEPDEVQVGAKNAPKPVKGRSAA